MMNVAEKLKDERLAYLRLRELWGEDPERYCRQRLGLNPTWQQKIILQDIQPEGARVSVRSGHGIGKDAIAAAIILWFMETRNFPRVPCTAPTGHQLFDVLWGELAKWIRHSNALSQQRGDHERFWLGNMFTHTQDSLYDNDAPKEWYAVARTARKEASEGLQGFHASDLGVSEDGTAVTVLSDVSLLFVVDEASGVPDVIYEVIEGALASPNCRLLEIGNATRNDGAFAMHHKRFKDIYTCRHFRSQDSPLVDPSYRDNLVRKFGETSNIVRVRADGEFPLEDNNALIAFSWCENALRGDDALPIPGRKRLGVDVARYGDDRTAFVLREANTVPYAAVSAKEDTMVTVGRALRIGQEWDVDDICVDTIGIGAGVYDRLVEVMEDRRRKGEWTCQIIGVNVAESAPQRPHEKDAQGRTLRDYVWLEVHDWLRDEQPAFMGDPDLCEMLAEELSRVGYTFDSSGRIIVEPKDKLKHTNRLGRSPDLADALCCTFVPLYEDESWEFV